MCTKAYGTYGDQTILLRTCTVRTAWPLQHRNNATRSHFPFFPLTRIPFPAMANVDDSAGSVQASAISSSSADPPALAHPKDTATTFTSSAGPTLAHPKDTIAVTPSPTNFVADAATSIVVAAPTPVSVSEATTTATSSAKNSSPFDFITNRDNDDGNNDEGRIIEVSNAIGTTTAPPSSAAGLACLAQLCTSILTESKKKKKRSKSNVDLDQHEEEEEYTYTYGNDATMPSSGSIAANTTIASIISPLNNNDAVARRSTIGGKSSLLVTTTGPSNDDDNEQKQPAFVYEDTLVSSAAASSPSTAATAKKKTRPSTLYTEDHPSEMNKTVSVQ